MAMSTLPKVSAVTCCGTVCTMPQFYAHLVFQHRMSARDACKLMYQVKQGTLSTMSQPGGVA